MLHHRANPQAVRRSLTRWQVPCNAFSAFVPQLLLLLLLLPLSFLECEHSTRGSLKIICSLPCRAIAQAVVRSLTLWQGPPGTGKTRTLLALVEVLVKTALAEVSVT
jgi:hypothetical protein